MTALPPGPFACILADPPWRFRTWSETNQAKSASRHYDLMTTEAIKALPVRDVAMPDCALFLWAVSPMLPQAFATLDAWGFTFKTMGFVWAKTSKNSKATWSPKWHYGLGYWTRANAEYCLLGVRGKPRRLSKSVPQLIVAPAREHSRKPDEAHERIEQLVAGPRLEIFARQSRRGWTTWGAQAERFDEPPMREAA